MGGTPTCLCYLQPPPPPPHLSLSYTRTPPPPHPGSPWEPLASARFPMPFSTASSQHTFQMNPYLRAQPWIPPSAPYSSGIRCLQHLPLYRPLPIGCQHIQISPFLKHNNNNNNNKRFSFPEILSHDSSTFSTHGCLPLPFREASGRVVYTCSLTHSDLAFLSITP